mgnify:FL=1
MDSKFVEGVVGGVLNRHKNHTLNKNKIAVLSVEIAAVLDDNIKVFSTGKSVNPSLNIEMWKGYKKQTPDSALDFEKTDSSDWKCKYCGKDMMNVDWDYVGVNGHHLDCELKHEMAYNEYLDKGKQMEIKFPTEESK